MVKYKVIPSHLRPEITAVECERETASSVFINGRRKAKRSTYENYYDTWDEAYSALIAAANYKAEYARAQLDRYEAARKKILTMRKPEVR